MNVADEVLVRRCECALSAVAGFGIGEAQRVGTAASRPETQVESWRGTDTDWVRAQTCTYDAGVLQFLAERAELVRMWLRMEVKEVGRPSALTIQMATDLAVRALPFARERLSRQDAPTELATIAWQLAVEDLEQMAGYGHVVTRTPALPRATERTQWGGRLRGLMENAGAEDEDQSRN